MQNKIILIVFSALISSINIYAQDSIQQEKNQWLYFNGYLKNLEQFSFKDNADSVYLTAELHNRLNFKVALSKKFEFNIGMRNRLFAGDQVKMIPGFADQIDADNGYFDLSFNWIESGSMVLNTTFDRLNADWHNNKFHFRVGRQRINWGINMTWNANDIFNSYNFLDFDYEERPGTDALLAEYNISDFSEIDVAYAPSKDDSASTAALRYKINTHNYDVQIIGGLCNTDYVLGVGWAGNLGDAGFKGEATWFQPVKKFSDSSGVLSLSAGIDYSFENGWYVYGAGLYNGYADGKYQSVYLLADRTPSAKNLMPDVYSFMLQTSKSFNPLFNASLSAVYSPHSELIIILPYASYSVTNSFDLDLFIQSYFAENFSGDVEPVNNSVYLRLRWSF